MNEDKAWAMLDEAVRLYRRIEIDIEPTWDSFDMDRLDRLYRVRTKAALRVIRRLSRFMELRKVPA